MKVRITEDCVACGLCVDICPDVFEMGERYAQVKAGVNPDKHAEDVRQAAQDCPVSAIVVER